MSNNEEENAAETLLALGNQPVANTNQDVKALTQEEYDDRKAAAALNSMNEKPNVIPNDGGKRNKRTCKNKRRKTKGGRKNKRRKTNKSKK